MLDSVAHKLEARAAHIVYSPSSPSHVAEGARRASPPLARSARSRQRWLSRASTSKGETARCKRASGSARNAAERAGQPWDQQNRLVRMLGGTHESVYDYDGESRRVRITEKENNIQTKQETFIWCGSRICQKRSGTTVLRSYFANGFEENGTTDYFYTRDHLGSVREVVASDGITVGSRLSYDPWGKVGETGTVLSDFTYTGHYYDRQSGLSLAWYRGYDPNVGRWLSMDPIGSWVGSTSTAMLKTIPPGSPIPRASLGLHYP